MLHLLTPNCSCAFRKKVYIFTKSAKLCISSPALSLCHCFKISAPPAVFARYILNSHCSNGCLLNTALWRKQNKPYKALEMVGALWSVLKIQPTLSTNERQNYNLSWPGHMRFPTFQVVASFFFNPASYWLPVKFSYPLIGCCGFVGFASIALYQNVFLMDRG